MPGLSHRKFAVLCRVSQQAISRAVREGRVVAGEDGIDPWHRTNRDYLALHGSTAPMRLPDYRKVVLYVDAPSDVEARCRQVAAKLALARQRLDEVRDDYHDRAEAVRVTTAETAGFVREFQALPKAYGQKLAEHRVVPDEVAGPILEKLVAALLDELGDLEGDATRLVKTA
jgi:hypothetical protein